MSCPIGQVCDVSREGFRLRCGKRPKLKVGEVHEVLLRAGGKQVRVASRVQWVRRSGLFGGGYEAGFAIVDSRPGVGDAVLQFGQFGCVSENGVRTGAQPTERARPAPAQAPPPPWSNAAPASAAPAEAADPDGQRTYDIPDEAIECSAGLDDLYALLEVSPEATDDEIRSAYRRLAREHHPDHSDSPESERLFAQIASAYAVLRDPKRRSWYDEARGRESAA